MTADVLRNTVNTFGALKQVMTIGNSSKGQVLVFSRAWGAGMSWEMLDEVTTLRIVGGECTQAFTIESGRARSLCRNTVMAVEEQTFVHSNPEPVGTASIYSVASTYPHPKLPCATRMRRSW